MIGETIGCANLNAVLTKTRNLFGTLESIAGRSLPVMDRNDHGDCLCLVDGAYLVDVDSEDVRLFVPQPRPTDLCVWRCVEVFVAAVEGGGG